MMLFSRGSRSAMYLLQYSGSSMILRLHGDLKHASGKMPRSH